jgi:CRISPR-associated protein (TIGR03986 family)
MGILNLPQHNNPSADSDPNKNRRSTAPYNFIPLPETVVTVADNDPNKLPSHDSYAHADHPYTGYFDVVLTTKSPLYVRGMQTRAEFDLDEQGLDRRGLDADGKDADGNQVRQGKTPLQDRLKNKSDFFHAGDIRNPIIPGSSLRGMLRSAVEIVSYSKVSRVANKKLVYRAVGDETALGTWYRDQLLGENRANRPDMYFEYPLPQLKGGYLCKHQGQWAIRPAIEHQGESFVHVDYQYAHPVIGGENRHTTHKVYVTPASRTPSGRGYRGSGVLTLNLAVTTGIASCSNPKPSGTEEAVLVESGHMGKPWGQTPDPHQKHMHCAIYAPNNSKTPIPIPPDAWQAYEEDRDATRGIKPRRLEKEGDPLFYLLDDAGKNVIFFGPTMMFRLPYSRSVWALIPDQLRQPLDVDFGDALFGFVREKNHFNPKHPLPNQGKKERAYSSRVRVSDGTLTEQYPPERLWLRGSERLACAPRILSTPKPTSFQHYLIQENPVRPVELSHYDSPTQNAEGAEKGHRTFIRGSKRYWPQGDKRAEEVCETLPRPQLEASTQHTLFQPLRSGVSFRFHVYFENLSSEELGALCWALHPVGDAGRTYWHQLGMGKPLGMGAVTLTATLHLNRRKERYGSLFSGDGWTTGYEQEAPLPLAERGARVKELTDAFEATVLRQLNLPGRRLAEVKRIAMLLRMMDGDNLLASTEVDTQDLRHGFRRRRVLPDPSAWISGGEQLLTPPGTEEPWVRDDPKPGTSGGGSGGNSSRMSNTLTFPPPEPEPPVVAAPAPKEEVVTLAGNINFTKRRAQIKVGDVQIACEKMPSTSFNAPKAGEQIRALVTRDAAGQPISATYRGKVE